MFVAAMIYLLAASSAPTEIAIGIGMVAPFFLTGFSVFFERGNYAFLHTHFPIGLPYSVDYTDMNLWITVILALVGLAARLVLATRTRWLTCP